MDLVTDLTRKRGCFAGAKWIAAQVGCTVRAVRKWTKRLSGMGYLIKVAQWSITGRQRSNVMVPTCPTADHSDVLGRVEATKAARAACEASWKPAARLWNGPLPASWKPAPPHGFRARPQRSNDAKVAGKPEASRGLEGRGERTPWLGNVNAVHEPKRRTRKARELTWRPIANQWLWQRLGIGGMTPRERRAAVEAMVAEAAE